jgi:uracil-DNA glycosylase
MVDYDAGPPKALADHFAALPSYAAHRTFFWYDWGPVFYRGRLDRSARLLGVASDPGPTERIACRTLVGDAGQRVQGFLAKLGLTHSYALVNAFAYALLPSKGQQATPMLSEPTHQKWRNDLLDKITGPDLQAIVAFGAQAREAVSQWPKPAGIPVFNVPHPSSRNATTLVNEWRDAIEQLRAVITPDSDGDATGPNYGSRFVEADYSRIPPRDLPFGVPAWLGDDAWGRAARPRHNNSVDRPSSDLLHTLTWRAPENQP